MSPAPSPVTMEPPVRIPSSAPVPPPPVIAEEATTETPTSETSSETVPPQPEVRKDYAYHAAKLRERDDRRPQRSRTPTPLSPGSTRMSDYGILSSPQVDPRKMKAPSQLHFEIERSSTPTRERMSRAWGSRKRREVMMILVVIPLFCRWLIGYRSPCLLRLSGLVPALRWSLLLPSQRTRSSPHGRSNQENLRYPE